MTRMPKLKSQCTLCLLGLSFPTLLSQMMTSRERRHPQLREVEFGICKSFISESPYFYSLGPPPATTTTYSEEPR
jgi:hypothetical protein